MLLFQCAVSIHCFRARSHIPALNRAVVIIWITSLLFCLLAALMASQGTGDVASLHPRTLNARPASDMPCSMSLHQQGQRLRVRSHSSANQGATALTVGSVLRGTIQNYVIFIGHYRGQPIQQPMKVTSFRIVPRRTDPTVSATAARPLISLSIALFMYKRKGRGKLYLHCTGVRERERDVEGWGGIHGELYKGREKGRREVGD